MTPMTRWQWLRLRVIEVSVALTVAFFVIQIASQTQEMRRDMTQPSEWFEVNEVFVPDHRAGEEPPVIYDRTIRQPFRGFWIVEVQKRDADSLMFTACSGAGVNNYETTDHIPGNTVTLEWILGKPCRLEPGRYRLRISYDLSRPGWPTKTMIVFSNTFTVS